MQDTLTQISIVLDRSGSMEIVRDATISGFNEFIDGQRAVPGEAQISLVQFDTEDAYEVLYEAKRIRDVPKMTVETYVPRGGTPLHDAIGRTIDGLGAKLAKTSEAERPGKVVIVIMTDGLENSSREYSSARIAEMIKHQREVYKWEFVFLGANQDAILTGEKLNILGRSSLTYAATAAGAGNALRAASRSLGRYRTNVADGASFTQEDREKANGPSEAR
jgi:Mg-chelatase subunit ChlD